ncbi:putative membrane protein [Malaciobacter mytili LMG 24559]|uniref:oligosaccharide repeat unit polymerase n=1 Tax=Malaciobacter mytili TaxID=603050 RepID=UPI000E10756F|nr:oligosaccharide repeat unit polymerase [Malaciobacter mytili]AXH14499.1 putative membrane protein [Malaciobacter mytili LMG 24559]
MIVFPNNFYFITNILIISWSSFLLLFFFGPIQYPYSSEIFYLNLIFFIGFYFGYFFYSLLPKKIIVKNKNENNENSLIIKATLLFSLLYLILVIYDSLIAGNVLEYGITVAREMMYYEGRRGSVIGMLNILLGGMPIIGITILIVLKKEEIGNYFYLLLGSSILGIFSYFLSGGRNFFVISLFVLFFVYLLQNKNRQKTNLLKKIKTKYKILIAILILLSISYVLYLFIERAELRGITVYDTAMNLERDFGVKVTLSPFQNEFLSLIYYIFVMLVFYITHSLSLLSEYFYINYEQLLGGVNTFPLFTMFIDKIFETSFYQEAMNKLLLNGIYLSLLGRVYLDFSFFGVFMVSFFLGIILNYTLSRARYSDGILIKLVSATMCATILLMPMYNILAGTAISIILSIFIIYFTKVFFLRKNDVQR